MRKIIALALALVMVCALAACGNPTTESSAPASESATESSAPAESSSAESTAGEGLKIAIITTSGIDDGSFNQDNYEGILAFIADNPTCTVTDIKEPDLNKCIQAVEDVIADYDVLVLPGFNYAACGTVAAENPDKKIILVDSAPTDAEGNAVELDNVYSMTFKEEESGFFAGVAAALQTKTNKVAVVNGIAYPSNVNYQFGFMSGVNYANAKYGTKAEIVELASYAGTDVNNNNVGGNYIGSFADEATGKVVGKALIDEGCDILFVAAGSSGNGVFAAAKEAKDVYVIGCDTDQYDDGVNGDSNIVLTSALKVMHLNVQRQLQAIVDGTFAGKNDTLGASTDSTGYVSEAGRQQLTEDTLAKLAECYDAVKAGTIVPASNFNGHTPTDFPGLA